MQLDPSFILLQEAAEIMSLSTSNCLVVLDELGRGTSTHDGTAIAYSTLVHFIEQVCYLLLVYYSSICPFVSQGKPFHPS